MLVASPLPEHFTDIARVCLPLSAPTPQSFPCFSFRTQDRTSDILQSI